MSGAPPPKREPLPGGFTLSSPASMWPILATVEARRPGWSVRDAGVLSYGAGEDAFGVQLNAYDDAGNIFQNVVLWDGKGRIGVGPGGATTVKCLWLACVVSPAKGLLWIEEESVAAAPLRGPGPRVALSFAERDEDGAYGGQCDVREDQGSPDPPQFLRAFLFPKGLQPTFRGAGLGLAGFGNGSNANFSGASFRLWLGQEGAPSPMVSGGCGSGESSNLISADWSVGPWQEGAEVQGTFEA